MKKSILPLVSAICLMIASCSTPSNNVEKVSASDSVRPATAQIFNLDTNALKAGEKYYQCEMNPEIISDKVGSCPTCGMDLSEIKKQ